MNPKTEIIIRYTVVCVWLAALGLTGYNIKKYPEQKRLLKRREQTLYQLAAIQQRQTDREQILQMYEQSAQVRRQDPATVLSRVDSGFQIISTGVLTPLFDGWVLEELQVEAGNIMLKRLGNLFDALQDSTPPWSVISCQLKADRGGRQGYGDAVLKIQSIYREDQSDTP